MYREFLFALILAVPLVAGAQNQPPAGAASNPTGSSAVLAPLNAASGTPLTQTAPSNTTSLPPIGRRLTFNPEFSIGNIAVSIAALVAAVTAVIAGRALGFAREQVAEAQKQRHSQMTQHIADILGSKESRERRRRIYNNIPSDPSADISNEDWSAMEDVWCEFERIAQYVDRGLVERDAIIETYSFGIIASWKKLKPFADLQAKRRGDPDRFLKAFKKLAEDAETQWREKYPGREIPKVVEWLPGYQSRP